jgi:hypothetical protein
VIDIIASLLYTAHAILQTEVAQRQRAGASPYKMIAVLHSIEAAALALKNENAMNAVKNCMEALQSHELQQP